MKFEEIFYSVFWISAISIIWFYTDTVLYYTRFFKWGLNMRLEYLAYIAMYPNKFFPDFLSEKLSLSTYSFGRFFGKLLACPACTTVWLSFIAAAINREPLIIAPVYVISLFVIYQIRNLI